jgi:hypothetical protein
VSLSVGWTSATRLQDTLYYCYQSRIDMRHKRLQHVANTLCHMFCGWQLMFSYPMLEQLGSGTLRLNVLTEDCSFNDTPIPPLAIAGTLAAWLRQELMDNHIDIAALTEATLTAQLDIKRIESRHRQRNNQYFGPNQQLLKPTHFTACVIACRSQVVTDEKTYTSEYHDYEEWPHGWTP